MLHHHLFHLRLLLLRVVCLDLFLARRYHVELRDNFESLLNIKSQGLKSWINNRLSFVKSFLLCNRFEIFNRFGDEGRDVPNFCEDFGIRVTFNELEELFINNLDVRDLFSVLIKNLGSCKKFVFLTDILSRKLTLKLVTLFLKAAD